MELLGALTAHVILVSSIVTFAARILFDVQPGHWVGAPLLAMVFPLAYLLTRASEVQRPVFYSIQVGLMLVWILALFLMDYVYEVDWRGSRSVLVPFIVLYFAGMGGMIGVASLAGKGWTISAVVLFLVAAVLAFVQRAVTGV